MTYLISYSGVGVFLLLSKHDVCINTVAGVNSQHDMQASVRADAGCGAGVV